MHAVSTGNTGEKGFSPLGIMTDDDKVPWSIDIHMKQRIINFKMDTSSDVTATSGETHQLIGKPKLGSSRKFLYGPVNQILDVMGPF